MNRLSTTPHIVAREQIPANASSKSAAVQIRSFGSNPSLAAHLPSSVQMAWIRVEPGGELPIRTEEHPALITILQGSGQLVGHSDRPVDEGDAITVPAKRAYGFINVGSRGLYALRVLFDNAEASKRRKGAITSLEDLRRRNEALAAESLNNPFFQLLTGEKLATSRARTRFRNATRVFSDAFQTMLYTRQATCRDPKFSAIFLDHMKEELGHNELLQVSDDKRVAADPILKSTASWFSHQMLVQDNLGKTAIVHLVLETAGFHFHQLASRVFVSDVSAEYFAVHSEADDAHKDIGFELLANQTPETYARLGEVIERGWSMFDALTGRIARLVELESASS